MNKPNIIYIMADDHAAHAMSCYGSRINTTPNIDRIASEGMMLNNCFCTNSICAPSRAVILTGKYSHLNGVKNLFDRFDGRQQTFPKLLQKAGYQTAMIGKWHLGHGKYSDPTGFDYWNVLPGQGQYFSPEFIEMGEKRVYDGYVTDVVTDQSLKWLETRDRDKPFFLMCHHKAPHYPYKYDEKHAHMYENVDIPEPETLHDNYKNRASGASAARIRIERDIPMSTFDETPPEDLSQRKKRSWFYQRYIKKYLRAVASIDDNVGKLLDYLDEEDISDNTIVVYTSDQGFFLGDHGWYDKRFMYEESHRMPFVIRYPSEIEAGSVCDLMALNTDFAPTFIDYAGLHVPEDIQGISMRPLLNGEIPEDWRKSIYYRYWMFPNNHDIYAHYGIRTNRYKLIYYYPQAPGLNNSTYAPEKPEWELFDLENDPREMNNVYDDPKYSDIVEGLKRELYELKEKVKDHG